MMWWWDLCRQQGDHYCKFRSPPLSEGVARFEPVGKYHMQMGSCPCCLHRRTSDKMRERCLLVKWEGIPSLVGRDCSRPFRSFPKSWSFHRLVY